jgi:hypothetical protein
MNEREKEALEVKNAIDEYIAQGGTVKTFPAGERSDPEMLISPWQKRKAEKK